MIFCTLFNWAYLAQGIVLYRSIEQQLGDDFILHILCMDERTADCIARLGLSNARIVRLGEIEDEALLAVKPNRSIGEYCWTCTTPLILHVQSLHPEGTVVTYVDADIAFFSSPRAILDELGDGSIFIHEHDFAPRYAGLEASSGRFNVGVSSFRNDNQGRRCLQLWKSQCLDECVMDFSAGKCGDQNYLDEWPGMYPELVVSADPGIGLGPWNVEKRRIERGGNGVLVDGRPAVFYHYHSLRLQKPTWGIRTTWLSGWFEIPDAAIDAFYRPYVRELWRAVDDVQSGGYEVVQAFDVVPRNYEAMPHHQVLMAVGRRFLSPALSSRGFDLIARRAAKTS